MSGIFLTAVLLLAAPPEYEHTIHQVSNDSGVQNTYIRPLSYGDEEVVYVPAFDDPVTYKELRYQAIYNCKNAKNVDSKIIDQLIAIEKQYDVPPRLRGMLLAAACSESGYNPNALGDWRTVKRRGKKRRIAKAVGLFQMWPWWESKRSGYGVDRNNVEQTAHAFMKHVKRQLKRIKCKRKPTHKRWVAAWVTAIRSPKVGGRCNERPKHLRHLKRWHKNIKRDRARNEFVPGC